MHFDNILSPNTSNEELKGGGGKTREWLEEKDDACQFSRRILTTNNMVSFFYDVRIVWIGYVCKQKEEDRPRARIMFYERRLGVDVT